MTFSELGLSESVLNAVEDAGYKEPTPIQAQAIPHVLRGVDVLGCAQTGTGKTAGFTLPMIDLLSRGRAKARMPRSLILEPTRELATQVAENFETYGKNNRLSMALLIGGVSFEDQNRKIDRGVDVLIATPGRLLDHFERGRLLMRGVEILVIDESDRMLDMGFIPDVERIASLLNPNRQTLFFSATMPPEIRRLADVFLKDPIEVSVAPPASPAETVEQSLSIVRSGDKRAALRALLRDQPVKNALIFCNRKRDVDIVATSLASHGFDAAALHGDMTQSHRTQTLERFKNGELKLMVCSDVAARGLDIAGLSHVFLFDLPYHPDDYVHRIGRTGRAGMRGRSFSFATPEDSKFLSAIEGLIGREIPRFEIDGIDGETVAEDDGRGRGRGRGGRTRREGSSSGGGRGRAKRENQPKDEAPAAKEDAPKESKPRTPRAKRSDAKPKTADGKTPARRREPKDDAPSGPGLGDHMPAFLMRPARPKGKS